ncbi:hypothetical protein JHW43_000173 [Diplocarpon mali]|nr:hypothetical protein JHW43_000173 [Diplocarpon mali]
MAAPLRKTQRKAAYLLALEPGLDLKQSETEREEEDAQGRTRQDADNARPEKTVPRLNLSEAISISSEPAALRRLRTIQALVFSWELDMPPRVLGSIRGDLQSSAQVGSTTLCSTLTGDEHTSSAHVKTALDLLLALRAVQNRHAEPELLLVRSAVQVITGLHSNGVRPTRASGLADGGRKSILTLASNARRPPGRGEEKEGWTGCEHHGVTAHSQEAPARERRRLTGIAERMLRHRGSGHGRGDQAVYSLAWRPGGRYLGWLRLFGSTDSRRSSVFAAGRVNPSRGESGEDILDNVAPKVGVIDD